MPILLLFFLFIVVPIAELYVLLQIGQQIGALATIALLILASVLGASLMRAQGRATWLRFSRALAEGRMPGREAVDGALVLFGGALLLTPGFLTDVLGLILLVPPTRALVRTMLLKRAMGRVAAAGGSGAPIRIFAFGSPRPAGPRPARRDEDVVDSSARDADDRRGELP